MSWLFKFTFPFQRNSFDRFSCYCVCLCPQILMSVRRAWLSATTTLAVSTYRAGTTVNAEVVSMTMDPTSSMEAPALVSKQLKTSFFLLQMPLVPHQVFCSSFSQSGMVIPVPSHFGNFRIVAAHHIIWNHYIWRATGISDFNSF